MTEFLKISDLTKRYQISRGTIYSLMNAGNFPAGVKFGRSHRWKLSDVEAFENGGGM